MKTLKKILIKTAIVASIVTGIYLAVEKVSNECDYTKKKFINCYGELIDKTTYFK